MNPNTKIVLAMHGMPPKDFPQADKLQFFKLRAALSRPEPGLDRQASLKRLAELDQKMRQWPRTPQNDAFSFAAQKLAGYLEEKTGHEVLLGYNEFCAPDLPEALDQAALSGVARVIVITPMMTRGGNHSEEEIPELIEAARRRHPGVSFIYNWPFDEAAIASFLAVQLEGSLQADEKTIS